MLSARILEAVAVIAGVVVGYSMGVFEQFSLSYYIAANIRKFSSPATAQSSRVILFTIQLCQLLANGTVLGFVSAKIVHSRAYRNAMTAAVLVIVVKVIQKFVLYRHVPGIWPREIVATFLFGMVFCIPAALYGAYMAQSFERNHSVRID